MRLHGVGQERDRRAGTAGMVPGEVGSTERVFPIFREILERTFYSYIWFSSVQALPKSLLFWFPFSETEQGPVWIQGQTGDRQGVQTDYVILVMNASSTLRPSATLKAEHFPYWTTVSPIMSNALGSASSSSFFPSSNNFLLIIPSLTPQPPSLTNMTHHLVKVHKECSSKHFSKNAHLLKGWMEEHSTNGEGLYICVIYHSNH